MASDDLELIRNWRSIRLSGAQIIDSTEDWIGNSAAGALDAEDVQSLAFFRAVVLRTLKNAEEATGCATATDRVAFDAIAARARVAWARLNTLAVDPDAV